MRSTTELNDGYEVLALDPNYIGACPCATFELDGTRIETHCWRTGRSCRIEFWGDRSVAERIKPLLDDIDWYGEWSIVQGRSRRRVPA